MMTQHATSRSRREFLQSLGMIAGSLALPAGAAASLGRLEAPIHIGLIADLHQDVMHDGQSRLEAFLQEMAKNQPDAIMQLGDFAHPNQKNEPLIEQFNRAHKQALHVIGNHDTDNGHTQQQCLDMWGMSGRYYSQKIKGLRFLVLDGNDRGSPAYNGGYPSFIGPEQVAWLGEQLEKDDGPTVVVSHQPLAGPAAVDNAEKLQELLSRYAKTVVLCINGHTHIDRLEQIGNVSYLHINSASYQWVGGDYKHESYPKEIHESHPWVSHTCPYRDSLFTTMSLDPASGTIEIKGRKSAWVGPSPGELGAKPVKVERGEPSVVPKIRSRRIQRTT